MAVLNREAYTVGFDSLIYDNSHPADGTVVMVTVSEGTKGTVKKGQVIDFADGAYSIHAAGGEPGVIAEESVEYGEEDTEVAVQAYTGGTLRRAMIVCDPELTDAEIETLRTKNIYLK